MYLFNKAKESIAKTLHSDKTSPLTKLTSICKFILKNVFVIAFSFMALIAYTVYLGNDINKDFLLKTFTICTFLLGVLSFIILKRTNGAYTLAKIKMYPFSIKDLVDISLSTGIVTISIIDILLGYIYLLVAFILFITAFISSYESLNSSNAQDNENINSFTVQFSSVLYMGLYLIAQIGIFRAMPYHPLEYLSFILKNIGEDVASTLKRIFKFLF